MNRTDYVLILISTKCVTRFLISDFEPNDFQPSDHYPRQLIKKIISNDFAPSDIYLRVEFSFIFQISVPKEGIRPTFLGLILEKWIYFRSFSRFWFRTYFEPLFMGLRALQVILVCMFRMLEKFPLVSDEKCKRSFIYTNIGSGKMFCTFKLCA